MKATIHPSRLTGAVRAPASKSSMQRACAAALLSKGTCVIHGPGHSDDDKAALAIIRDLGARVSFSDEECRVTSEGVRPVAASIDAGESGLSVRLFTPIAALSDQPVTINGKGSLLERPMELFDQALPQLGIQIISNKGRLPLLVKGPIRPASIEIDGSVSSQFLTGLLMAFSAANATNVSIRVKNLASKPYIDLTLQVMKEFGMKLPSNEDYREFYFDDKPLPPVTGQPIHYTVESDWSGAAFLLVAGAIAGPVTIRGLDLASAQADKAIVDVLMRANAGISMEAKGINIRPSPMNAFEFDATDCPDLVPPLVALAAYCKGTSLLNGAHRLLYKESNRARVLQQEFSKMGVVIEWSDDQLRIKGGGRLKGATLHPNHDHRMAMAFAVAALKATGETLIEEAEAVNKSYPDFFRDLKTLGADVSLPFDPISRITF